jgi:hypothetical protein
MMTAVSAIMAIHGGRFWIKAGRAVLALAVVVAGGLAIWYRAAYHAWPGLEPSRVWPPSGSGAAPTPGRPEPWPQPTHSAQATSHIGPDTP